MRLRLALLTICTMLAATAAQAQFNAVLYNFTQPITSACAGGSPIPDGGAYVQIFWDSTGNGRTPDDHIVPEGAGSYEFNLSQFAINGVEQLETPGGFYSEPAFTAPLFTPNPDQGTGHPLFWLRVCLDANGITWVSDTFRVQSGFQDIGFGSGAGEVPMTCLTGGCGECPTPNAVTNVTATQAECNVITVSWQYGTDDHDGFRLLVDNTPPYIYVPDPAARSYSDANASGGVDHLYRVRAYNICDDDTSFSTGVETMGRRRVDPPVPQEMTASDDQCSRVEINWSVNTVLGLDSFRIYRNGTLLVGGLPRGAAGQDHQYFDNAPLGGVVQYCVVGLSDLCGEGDDACDNGASSGLPTCSITNVVASADDCEEVCVTFTSTCAEADSFIVFRGAARVGAILNAGGPNFTVCHDAPAGQQGTYQVRAKNDCGMGALQPEPGVPGLRLAAPGALGNVQASDTLCDKVRVTWNDLADIINYKVLRSNSAGGWDTLATVAENVNQYDDLTAVAGASRTYRVLAVNECGPGAPGNGNSGTRRAPGTGQATFTMTQAGPPNWTYSMDVTTGCMNRVKIRDYCEGTTATAPTGWTVNTYGLDSIVFSTTNAVGAGDAPVTGFGLSHPTCDGDGRWSIGQSGGSIRGPLPVGENAELPTEYGVKVFPNPFNPVTNFKIAIPQSSLTTISVYNIAGQLVKEMDLGNLQAGYHTIQFGGSDLASGMYFARVQAGSFQNVQKLMLMK